MNTIWIVSAVWMVAVVLAAWHYLTAPSRGGLIVYLVIGLAGLVPSLWLIWFGELPGAFRYLLTAFWVLVAAGSAVWATRRRRERR